MADWMQKQGEDGAGPQEQAECDCPTPEVCSIAGCMAKPEPRVGADWNALLPRTPYFVLPRLAIEAMPKEWQERLAQLLEEARDTDMETPSYFVFRDKDGFQCDPMILGVRDVGKWDSPFFRFDGKYSMGDPWADYRHGSAVEKVKALSPRFKPDGYEPKPPAPLQEAADRLEKFLMTKTGLPVEKVLDAKDVVLNDSHRDKPVQTQPGAPDFDGADAWNHAHNIREKDFVSGKATIKVSAYDDGRPCATDLFINAITRDDGITEVDYALKCWNEGDWDNALSCLSDELQAELRGES